MKRLELDFRRSPATGAAGWALLAAGVVLAGTVLWAGVQIRDEVAAQEASARQILASLPEPLRNVQPTAVGGMERDGALAGMQRVQESIDNRPWQSLFATLEALASKDIALLSLTPDARKHQVRITAEARDLGAMLDYHRKLEDTPALRDVSLVNHEFAEQVQGRPVRFSLLASWVTDHATP
ncbi:pilus assembly protein [Aromatoleum toluvorans]|uniref:Pilus assembly protein n=1 Tax=Aromatoleum toluvorans TaxID=92002 RepID=A0ABX1Q422_9RHOO|nr:pilus assembly protein [Aromatoleum toluvorans]NMG46165.1 pilus assembly protein [Aromatoleum toluvorans]